METDALTRKLAAILYADVAGYSRLSGGDEAREALAKALKERPNLSIGYLKDILPTKYENGLERYLQGMRKAGLGES